LFLKHESPIVLALARGGVPVGYEVAKALNAPFDVLLVRKISSPHEPELALGAIAEQGVQVIDHSTATLLGVSEEDLKKLIKKERNIILKRKKAYKSNALEKVSGRVVIIVDDGLATGLTARAAINAVKNQKLQKIIFAVPVCSREAKEGTNLQVEVVCLFSPLDFRSVGMWYKEFEQLSDTEVIHYLAQSKKILEV
jgi:putative phosphoribosyl transferase